jgi:hypothetical protein
MGVDAAAFVTGVSMDTMLWVMLETGMFQWY